MTQSSMSNGADAVPHELTLLGVDFTCASLAEREALSYDDAQARSLLARAATVAGVAEAVVLSTCNRSEFYLVGPAGGAERFLQLLRVDRPDAAPHSSACRLQHLTGEAAARHLCRVACGTASLLLGDAFVIRQMKEALARAGETGTLGPVLNQAFRHAFRVAQAARRTTDISRGETSLGAVVATTVAEAVGPTARVLLVGAGTTARDIARQLAKRRVGRLVVVNRTRDAADALARACAARVAEWHELDREIRAAQAVVCATSARAPIITMDRLEPPVPLLIDASVPRNIAPPPGSTCVTVDDLVARQDDARARRERAVPEVERLIDAELDRWRRWIETRPLEALLKRLFESEAAARQRLAAEALASGWPGAPEAFADLVSRCSSVWLKRHAAELRQWARAGGDAPLVVRN